MGRVLHILSLVELCAVLVAPIARAAEAPPSFDRDVRPLLATNCFPCHGPDEGERKAHLRLDVREVAVERKAIVPGDPTESELIRRIFSSDLDERMPPPEAGKTLSDEAKEILRRWVASGAKYERHWAFVPPARPPVPGVANSSWVRNPIDSFVLARLESAGLEPSPEADRYTLVRRLYLDLVGVPPTPEEADAFVREESAGAYESLVDRLLASPRYGERWARQWLDLARYSDTNGYEKDRPRTMWPYRDWVIRAINADMPFDRFTIEQIAGDMLPNATESQRIATGFHRNTMLNEEGGIDPLEFRFYAMVDRVATTGTVWLGLTTGCAQCHSHKYDPISHEEYYRLMALLDNADEPDLAVTDGDVLARRRALEERISRLEDDLEKKFPPREGEKDTPEARRENFERSYSTWLEKEKEGAIEWKVIRPRRLESNLPRLELLDDGSIFSSGDITKRDVFKLEFELDGNAPVAALRLEVLPDDRLPAGGPGRAYYEGRKGDFFLSEVTARVGGDPVEFRSASVSYGKIAIGSGSATGANVIDGDGSTGWSTAEREGEAHQLVLNLAEPLREAGTLEIDMLFERHFAASLGRFRFAASSPEVEAKASDIPVAIEDILVRDEKSWSESERRELRRHYLRTAPELADARQPIDRLRAEMPALPHTLVLEERPPDNPRKTYRHHRGEYLSAREEVSPGVPAVFAPLPEDQPANRLTFARWLVSDCNPLVARVTVNRAWRAFFGAGIVRTSGDFGTQSAPPSHPELLDWLACELPERGWSVKHIHRLIVTSSTYRQSARVSPELLARDPENRFVSRGPRHRLDAEIVRDAMLRASGLLTPEMYGPSVYPPQPASVTALAYGATTWNPSRGSERYRRSLYTFSKRTAPFAAYAVFDAPSGESCTARRDRSNTPLQALTVLNDEMFLEMARALARVVYESHRDSPTDCATQIFRRVLTRHPDEEELDLLLSYQKRQRARLEEGELDPPAICGSDDGNRELASWVMLARSVMNLDEAITKP